MRLKLSAAVVVAFGVVEGDASLPKLRRFVGGEFSKYGITIDALPDHFHAIKRLPYVDVRGLMTVAPIAAEPEDVRPIFRALRKQGDALGVSELSMGMTDDFEVAIEEGATHVRIGRALFGDRG